MDHVIILLLLSNNHFFRDHVSAQKQFSNFKKATEDMEMNLRPVIDYERDGWKESMSLRTKRLHSLVKLFQKEYGDDIVIYCSSIDFLLLKSQFPECTFWIMSPHFKLGTIHQKVENINGKEVDINRTMTIPKYKP